MELACNIFIDAMANWSMHWETLLFLTQWDKIKLTGSEAVVVFVCALKLTTPTSVVFLRSVVNYLVLKKGVYLNKGPLRRQ